MSIAGPSSSSISTPPQASNLSLPGSSKDVPISVPDTSSSTSIASTSALGPNGSSGSIAPASAPVSAAPSASIARTLKAGGVPDFRAEEETARRLNAGRAVTSSGSNEAKSSDLYGPGVLKAKFASLAQQNDLIFDDDALSYLALAAENRLRSILTSSLKAQLHRSSSSHNRIPPMTKSGQPMWSYSATSDPNAVLEAMSKENKEAEQSFRASRMDRLARETELQRAREKAAEQQQLHVQAEPEDASGDASMGEQVGSPRPNGNDDIPNGSGTASAAMSTPVKASSTGSGSGSSTPVFGAVTEKRGGSSSAKKGGAGVRKGAREVSAELQHKMSNAMAMRSIGMSSKKYSWLNAPPVSSPLANTKSKKRKNQGKDKDKDKDGDGTDRESLAGTPGPDGVEEPSTNGDRVNGDVDTKEVNGKGKKKVAEESLESRKKRRRIKLSEPTRRQVVISKDKAGVEKTMTDDRVLTISDVLFTLEREDPGRGLGINDEHARYQLAMGSVGHQETGKR